MLKNKKQKEIWSKAIIVACIFFISEIIFGSFWGKLSTQFIFSLFPLFAATLLTAFNLKPKTCPQKVFIITGDIGNGKTTFSKKLIEKMIASSFKCKGILALGLWKDEKRYGFDLENIQTQEKVIFCRTDLESFDFTIGQYRFSTAGYQFGKNTLESIIPDLDDIVVIDEIGPLEINGKGWAESLRKILDYNAGKIIIVVRRKIINEVIAKFELNNSEIIDINNCSIDEAFDKLFAK